MSNIGRDWCIKLYECNNVYFHVDPIPKGTEVRRRILILTLLGIKTFIMVASTRVTLAMLLLSKGSTKARHNISPYCTVCQVHDYF